MIMGKILLLVSRIISHRFTVESVKYACTCMHSENYSFKIFKLRFLNQKVRKKNLLRIQNSLHKNVRGAHKLTPAYNISVGIADFRNSIE